MEKVVNDIIEYIKLLAATNNPVIVTFLAASVIIIESIIPILPLAVFITLNMFIFGNIGGFILSWVSTLIGCTISFYIFRNGLYKYIYKFLDSKELSRKMIARIDNIKFSNLILITALPFTPAFSINIACGLSKMAYKKYILAMMIAKISLVYFWGFVGKSLIESVSDVSVLLKILALLIITHLISEIVKRNVKVE